MSTPRRVQRLQHIRQGQRYDLSAHHEDRAATPPNDGGATPPADDDDDDNGPPPSERETHAAEPPRGGSPTTTTTTRVVEPPPPPPPRHPARAPAPSLPDPSPAPSSASAPPASAKVPSKTNTNTHATTSSTAAIPPPPPPARPPKPATGGGGAGRTTRRPQHKAPSLDPYIGKLERYELFCTNQSYYLVGCNKQNSQYRVIKMDRTLIERPASVAAASGASAENQHHTVSAASDRGEGGTGQPGQVQPSASNASHASSDHLPTEPNSLSAAAAAAAAAAAHNSKPTLRDLSEFLTEDPNVYTQGEIQDMLDMIHDGNWLRREDHRAGEVPGQGGGGGLKPIAKAYGIVGFIKFLDCYHLTLITRRAKVGSVGGNGIYTIKNTETFPIRPAERVPGAADEADVHADPSSVLLNMWNRGKRSVGLGLTNREIAELRYQGLYQVVDLTKNFFFSYTYDLTRSLQENFLSNTSQPFPPPPFKDMFAWNYFLTRELEECTNSLSSFHWVMPIIHGAFVQRKLNDYSRSLNVVLLARRSRHFAGTRYLKRGVSEQGKVANDVEHEQILHDESRAASHGVFSSYLQVRGSIPTFWTQESSVTMPKPPIELNRVDPTYTATQLHFEDLLKRYGSPIVVLDLVKQSEKREREVRVGNEYRHAIDYINMSIDSDEHKIRYCALDYSHISKHRHLDVSTSLNEVSTWAVNQTGFFCSAPEWKIIPGGDIVPFGEGDYQAASVFPESLGVPTFPMEQTGVLRTNCIDCLDRTNVAQFSAGVEAMEQQLVVMGIRSNPKLDPSSTIVRVLIDMYVDIGDHIALQYGGSEAHKKVTTERSESIVGPIGKHKELLTSIRRYYSNAFTDRMKQDAMNLFLGYYIPCRHTIPLWELETDYYLHNFHVEAGKGMKAYQKTFGVLGWNYDDDEDTGTNVEPVRRGASHRAGPASLPGSSKDFILPEQSLRIQRVRDRCSTQNSALSVWWKVAIQSNVQQRMWMQLGRSPAESMLPPRFERLYQPEKMAQFDRFFARSWATPVRRSHSAQHSGEDDDEVSELRQKMYGRPFLPLEATRQTENGSGSTMISGDTGHTSLDQFISTHGFQPRKRPTMRRFVQQHDIPGDGRKSSTPASLKDGGLSDKLISYRYIGDTNRHNEIARDEYVRCVSSLDNLQSSLHNPIAFDEFKESLHAMSLNANDVIGIQELAESAHVGRTIKYGPYKGLDRDFSAIEVSTVVFEQVNAYENIHSRGELQEGIPLMDAELQRRGFFTDGVKGTIAYDWDRHVLAEKQYNEMFLESNYDYRRSDLTTTNSLELYTSFFSPDQAMTTPDLTILLGETPRDNDKKVKPGHVDLTERSSDFVTRASRLNIPITSHTELARARSQPLFQFDRKQSVPAGFEMINEDMFARKDNKFMVFNGAGVDSWRDSKVTKSSGIEKMLSGTLK